MATDLTPLFTDGDGNGIYKDQMERFWFGYHGPARVWVDGKRVIVPEVLQFLVWEGLVGPAMCDGYSINGTPAPKLDLKREAKKQVEPASLKDDSQAEGKCEVCGTPLNAAQIKRGGKYCGRTCANKAKSADDDASGDA